MEIGQRACVAAVLNALLCCITPAIIICFLIEIIIITS